MTQETAKNIKDRFAKIGIDIKIEEITQRIDDLIIRFKITKIKQGELKQGDMFYYRTCDEFASSVKIAVYDGSMLFGLDARIPVYRIDIPGNKIIYSIDPAANASTDNLHTPNVK